MWRSASVSLNGVAIPESDHHSQDRWHRQEEQVRHGCLSASVEGQRPRPLVGFDPHSPRPQVRAASGKDSCCCGCNPSAPAAQLSLAGPLRRRPRRAKPGVSGARGAAVVLRLGP